MATSISPKHLNARARATAAALLTAAFMVSSLTGPPPSRALAFDAVTTGPLLRIAQLLLPLINGSNTISVDVPVIGSLDVTLNSARSKPTNLYNMIDDYPFGGFTLGSFFRQPGGALGTAILAASGPAGSNAVRAYEALLASGGGNTPDGFTPLAPAGRVNLITGASCTSGISCVQGVNVTNLAALLVNDWGTPNGGIESRFGPLLKLFGVDLSRPGGSSASSTGLQVNVATASIGWGYSLLSDFPVNLNLFSLVNSLLATILPTNLLGGIDIAGDSVATIGTNIGLLATLGTASTSYSTLAPKDLPLLEPLRLPSRIVNLVAGALGIKARLGTPLANALQPALQLLVNLGYTDVQTPGQGGTYNRTYDQSGVYTPFLSRAVLTPKQWLQVPGDVIRALIVGFQDQFPILRFGRPAPRLVPNGDHLAISYTPAPPPAPPVEVAATPATSASAPPVPRASKSRARHLAAVGKTVAAKDVPDGTAHSDKAGQRAKKSTDTGKRQSAERSPTVRHHRTGPAGVRKM